MPDENSQAANVPSDKLPFTGALVVVRIHNGYLCVLHGNGWRR